MTSCSAFTPRTHDLSPVHAVARAWRRWRDRPQALLPVGPQHAGPWAGTHGPDRDRDRVLSDLRATAGRSPWA